MTLPDGRRRRRRPTVAAPLRPRGGGSAPLRLDPGAASRRRRRWQRSARHRARRPPLPAAVALAPRSGPPTASGSPASLWSPRSSLLSLVCGDPRAAAASATQPVVQGAHGPPGAARRARCLVTPPRPPPVLIHSPYSPLERPWPAPRPRPRPDPGGDSPGRLRAQARGQGPARAAGSCRGGRGTTGGVGDGSGPTGTAGTTPGGDPRAARAAPRAARPGPPGPPVEQLHGHLGHGQLGRPAARAAPARSVRPSRARGTTTGIDFKNKIVHIALHGPLTGAGVPQDSFTTGTPKYWENHKLANGFTRRGRRDRRQVQRGGRLRACNAAADNNFLIVGGAGTDQISACAQSPKLRRLHVPYLSSGVTEAGLGNISTYHATSLTYKQQAPLLVQLAKDQGEFRQEVGRGHHRHAQLQGRPRGVRRRAGQERRQGRQGRVQPQASTGRRLPHRQGAEQLLARSAPRSAAAATSPSTSSASPRSSPSASARSATCRSTRTTPALGRPSASPASSAWRCKATGTVPGRLPAPDAQLKETRQVRRPGETLHGRHRVRHLGLR